MKEFCFWDEDDLDNLPKDFKLVPFRVEFFETPKTSTSEMSPPVPTPSESAKAGLSNPVAFD